MKLGLMKTATTRKLRSQKGASFLLALAVFFVCSMVAASVVAAASANAQKTGGTQQAQQSYLTVSSAARLLADDLDQNAYAATGTVRASEYTCAYPASHASSAVNESSFALTDGSGAASSTALAQLLSEGMSAINPGDPGARYIRYFTVQADGYADVDAVFTMFGADGTHDVYDIEIVLSSTIDAAPNSVIVSAKASTATEVVSSVDVGTCEHFDQWQFKPAYEQQALLDPEWATAQTPAFDAFDGNYVQRDTEYGQALATSSALRDTTWAQTVTWGKAYIAKGQVQ